MGLQPILFSMRAILLASWQHCGSVDVDAQCKRALKLIHILALQDTF